MSILKSKQLSGSLDVTSSYAITASYALNGGSTVNTSSFVTTSSFNTFTSSFNTFTSSYNTGSFSGSFTGVLTGTASWASNATNANSGSNFVVTSTLRLDESLIDFGKQVGTGTGTYSLFDQATGSFTSAHGKYTLSNGANARAGEFVTVWNGTNITYYDNATTDIGSTTNVSIQSAIVSSQIKINAVTLSSGWTIKMIVTYL